MVSIRKSVVCIALLLLLLNLCAFRANADTLTTGIVTVDNLNLRSDPVIGDNVITKLSKDTPVTILDKLENWYKVKTDSGVEGWVSSEYITLTDNTNASTETSMIGIVAVDELNFRSEPVIGDNIIVKLPKNTELTILDQQDSWYKVRSAGNIDGWVSKEYITLKNATKTGVVTTSTLNCREKPALDAAVIAKLSEGTKVTILNQQDAWYQIKLDNDKTGWVSSEYVLLKDNTVSRGDSQASTGSLGLEIVAYAKDYLDVPYVWGGTSPKGFDCSGFVYYVFSHFGIELDRVSTVMATQGTKVSKSELQPGDLVFFDTNGGHNKVNHVGIYIGDGQFIQASSGKNTHKVVITDLLSDFYADAYMGARRVINN